MSPVCAWMLRGMFAFSCGIASGGAAEITDLIEAWSRASATHPHIPYAAQAGSLPGPDPFAGATVAVAATAFGLSATATAQANDMAMDLLLAECREMRKRHPQSRILVNVPAGRFLLSGIVRIDVSGLSLHGAGEQATELHWSESLDSRIGNGGGYRAQEWAYLGGMLWVAPSGDGDQERRALRRHTLAGEYEQGARVVRLEQPQDAAAFTVGQRVIVRWETDDDWLAVAFGHPSYAAFDRKMIDEWRPPRGRYPWHQVLMVKAVTGSQLEFHAPLRMPVRPAWKVSVLPLGALVVTDIDIRDLRISFPEHQLQEHLEEKGFNALYLERVINARIERVTVENSDNAIILDRAAHCLVTGVTTRGMGGHHGVSLRSQCQDNLITGIHLAAPVRHGLSIQDLSAGNVFSASVLDYGTIDSHRGMPFDTIRTDIVIRRGGWGGGAVGPLLGRRTVSWNIRFETPEEVDPRVEGKMRRRWIHKGWHEQIVNPLYLATGAVIGCTGFPTVSATDKLYAMPEGDKGTLLIGGAVPDGYGDLHRIQQRMLR